MLFSYDDLKVQGINTLLQLSIKKKDKNKVKSCMYFHYILSFFYDWFKTPHICWRTKQKQHNTSVSYFPWRTTLWVDWSRSRYRTSLSLSSRVHTPVCWSSAQAPLCRRSFRCHCLRPQFRSLLRSSSRSSWGSVLLIDSLSRSAPWAHKELDREKRERWNVCNSQAFYMQVDLDTVFRKKGKQRFESLDSNVHIIHQKINVLWIKNDS